MPIVEQKKRLRVVAAQRREALTDDQRSKAARAVAESGLSFAPRARHATISAYHPIGAELDCMALMARLAEAGHTTCLPIVAKRGEPLIFRRWAPGEPLKDGLGGIPVPPRDAAVVEPDILFVPLLAFDRRGYRLGYGGGYYDRTLTALRARRPTLAVGLAFAAQEVAAVPHLDYDARLDAILTEEGPIAVEGARDAPALRR
jgi:5-formyltetrahydrofolate cyclo-ligase